MRGILLTQSQQFIKEMFKSSPILCRRLLEWKERDWTDRGIYELAETSPLYQEYKRKRAGEAPNTADRADENRKKRGSRRSST